MSLTAEEIDAVVRELAPLAGARVDEVRLQGERALTLELFGPAGAARLLVSAEPDVTRLHVTRARTPRAAHPSAFQQLLRRELVGARLAAIEPLAGDRVVALRLERPQGPLRLVAELTGRHGNVFLVGADGVILASAGTEPLAAAGARPGCPVRAARRAARRRPCGRPLRAGARRALPALRRD